MLAAFAAPAFSQTSVTTPSGWAKTLTGGDISYVQPESGGRIVIRKLSPLSGSLRDWFETQTERDSRTRGAVIDASAPRLVGDRYLLGRIFRSGSQSESVIYYGYAIGSQGRLVIYSAPPDTIKQNVSTFTQLTNELYASDRNPKSQPLGSVKTGVPSTGNITPSATRDRRKVGEFWGVFLNETYISGVGGMPIITYEPVLVTRNGWARRNPDLPPGDLLTLGDKAAHPSDWGRWTRQGDKLVVRWDAKDSDELKVSFKSPPAQPGQKISGSYTSLRGGGNTALGGDTMTFSSNSYTFARDGRFAAISSGGGTSPAFSAGASSNSGGHYQLDGYSITFKFNDGRTVRRLFFLYPGKNEGNVIGIGDKAFVGDD